MCRPVRRERAAITRILFFFTFFVPLAGETYPMDSACAPSLEHSCLVLLQEQPSEERGGRHGTLMTK